MGSGMDEMKGRAKEAAGDLTDNEDLKREGKIDELGASMKEKAEQAKDKVDSLIDKAKEKLDGDR